MEIIQIKTEADYQAALKRLREIWESPEGSSEGEEEDYLSYRITKYEEEHYPIDEPDPIEYIKVRMEELGLRDIDLIPYIGDKGTVSKVLNRKRNLSITMIRNLVKGLRMPAEVLIAEPSH